jgi:hypothetical protein
MVTPDDIRTVALSLPRTEEALVRDQAKFRVGRIVYVALSRDELSMGFGFSEGRARRTGRRPSREVLHADSVGPALQLGPSVAGRDRLDRDAGTRRRRVEHGRAEANCRRVSR